MNRNRKNRLNLSLVRKSESPKSPVRDRSVESTSECKTPFNSRKRSSTYSDGSPVLNDYDSPIPMSQDTSNMVTGVSWAWNSPKRAIPEECRPKPRPLLASNNIQPKEPDLRKKTTERLVGFYKFQEELKKIQQEAQQTAAEESQDKSTEIKPSSPSSPNGKDLFDSFGEMEADCNKALKVLATDVQQPTDPPYLAPIDSFNDSAFDSLLLQASQAADAIPPFLLRSAPVRGHLRSGEKVLRSEVTQINTAEKSQIGSDASASNEGTEITPMKRKSFFKSRTINDLDSFAINDLLNDSTDFCLIEASQMIESNLNKGEQKPTEPGSSKKINTLTRHKSLPASPCLKIPATHNTDCPSSSSRSKFEANFLKNDSSSSAAPSSESSAPQPVRLCTKEEIEQKRQEALKRRRNRLGLGNALLNNNHAAAKKS